MGVQIAAQSGTIGGQNDPAHSTLDNSGGMFGGKYWPIAPGRGTLNAWHCIGYWTNSSGITTPTQTWVAFAKPYAGEGTVTINGATFDLTGIIPGELMLYIAFGDGNAANPWQVTYAICVFRGTGGSLGDTPAFPGGFFTGNGISYDYTIVGGTTTVYIYNISSYPFASTRSTNLIDPYDPLGLNGGTTGVNFNVGAFGTPPGIGYAAFTLVAETGLTYTKNGWVPGGLGASGLQPPNSWYQSQGVDHEWGLPDQAHLVCRDISMNDQTSNIPAVALATGGTDNFFVQLLAQDYVGHTSLGDIGGRLNGEGWTGPAGTTYAEPDIGASKVRPEFIDQTLEAGGGIFLYS